MSEKDSVDEIYGKFTVRDEYGALVGDCFVLIPGDDNHAREALRAYANRCREEMPELAAGIFDWLLRLERDVGEFFKHDKLDFFADENRQCCTDDGHTQKDPVWRWRRDLHGNKLQRLVCADCGCGLGKWEPASYDRGNR